jgi:putative heme-binding domain-containing protein
MKQFRRINQLLLVPCLILCSAPSLARAQVRPTEPGFTEAGLKQVRAFLQDAVDRRQIPGAVGLLMRRGQVAFLEAVGQRDAEAGLAMTPDTMFRIASMTKPVTSVAVMLLVEEGKIRLQDPVSRFIPEFRDMRVYAPGVYGKDVPNPPTVPAQREITIRDLLTHTSGLVYGFSAAPPLLEQYMKAGVSDGLVQTEGTTGDNARKLAKLPLAHQPGAAWSYSLGTDVLGHVVEVASGMPLDRFFRERIFEPLKMPDTSFFPPEEKKDRLAALYSPGPDKTFTRVGDEPRKAGSVTFSAGVPYGGPRTYFSGGAGLVSTARDYGRFLQMLLGEGQIDGVRLLAPQTVRLMTTDHIAPLEIAFTEHGHGFGYGFGIITPSGPGPTSLGSFSWGGAFNTMFWVDPQRDLIGVLMTQLLPSDHKTFRNDYQKRAYEALAEPAEKAAFESAPVQALSELPSDGRFLKIFWFEPGLAHGNPTPNGRFRVNAPEVILHPQFSQRSEARSSGMLQILMDRDPAGLAKAELFLELWGGHPGTTRKRVSVNGRSTYPIPEVGTSTNNCTHEYPIISLKKTDLVNGYNAFQFACDQGSSFWGHFIVDNACVRAELPEDDSELRDLGLNGFRARVEAAPSSENPEAFELNLAAPENQLRTIASIDFLGLYDGYDENGDGRTLDWHGMTKDRQPLGHLGTSRASPFSMSWDVSMLPDQEAMGVRAVVRFKEHPSLIYITPPTTGLRTPQKRDARVRRIASTDLPRPFLSRAGKLAGCTFVLKDPPSQVERAELRLVMWDGGAGTVASPWSLNGKPLPIASLGKHDVVDLRVNIDPGLLTQGVNVLELRSDTEHHGIEVLLPGPELFVRSHAQSSSSGRVEPATDSAALRRYALGHEGDAERGKRLFASQQPMSMSCSACHKARGEGGDIGPDLTDIGNKFERVHLIESVLEPSRQIVEGFRVTVLNTKDGRVLSGVVRSETEADLTLMMLDGKRETIRKADIDARRITDTSLMPENLVSGLSATDFADLIAYLESLRPNRKPTPGERFSDPPSLPTGFIAARVAEGLTAATALEVAPDGRVFVCEQTGTLRIVKRDSLLPEPFLHLKVDSNWERGLIGVTLDPEFTSNGFVYVCYVVTEPYPHHRISRFTALGDLAVSGSEVVLLEGDDQTKMGGTVPAGHQGGALHFGSDGKLYIALGEQTAGQPSQDLHSLLGKLLRVNCDGTIPADNPFVDRTEGKYDSIWALGLRNPFTFAVQPLTGRIFINDVGQNAWEEVNEGIAGANYGWPASEGPTTDPGFRAPIHFYPNASISGAAFCPADSPWPEIYRGKYFFMDFVRGWIKFLDPEDPSRADTFATGLARPVDLRFAPDGSLYVLLRDAWVIDREFRPGTGSLLKIRTE